MPPANRQIVELPLISAASLDPDAVFAVESAGTTYSIDKDDVLFSIPFDRSAPTTPQVGYSGYATQRLSLDARSNLRSVVYDNFKGTADFGTSSFSTGSLISGQITQGATSTSKIRTNGWGGFTIGYAASSGAGSKAYLGSGIGWADHVMAIAWAYGGDSIAVAAGDGGWTLVSGEAGAQASAYAYLTANAGGAAAIGQAVALTAGGRSEIVALGIGSHAQGQAFTNSILSEASIFARGNGSWAQGYAYGYSNRNSRIYANPAGSMARGAVLGQGQICVDTYGKGGFASGFVYGKTPDIIPNGIRVSKRGGFAHAVVGQSGNNSTAQVTVNGEGGVVLGYCWAGDDNTKAYLIAGRGNFLLGYAGSWYTGNNVAIKSYGFGSFAGGYVGGIAATIRTGNGAGFAHGSIYTRTPSGGQLLALYGGSFAQGYLTSSTLFNADEDTRIQAIAQGAFARGRAHNSGIIQAGVPGGAYGKGAHAFGFAGTYAASAAAYIKAMQRGAVAFGDALVDNVGVSGAGAQSRIYANAFGGFAWGHAQGKDGHTARIHVNAGSRGAMAGGSVYGNALLEANTRGALAHGDIFTGDYGYGFGYGQLVSQGQGATAHGSARAYGSFSNATVNALGPASLVHGRAHTNGQNGSISRAQLLSYGTGAIVAGYAYSYGHRYATVEADGNGALALGSAFAFSGGGGAGHAYINAHGSGSIAAGYAYTGGGNGNTFIVASPGGSIAHGYATAAGRIRVGNNGKGGFAQGWARKGYINAFGAASWASGYALDYSSYIKAKGPGDFARGYVAGDSFIYTYGKGSVALGVALSGGLIHAYDVPGSFAFGYAYGQTIVAKGRGSLAIGFTGAGLSSIQAQADNSFQFGKGTNAVADSLRVGVGIRLSGVVDGPASPANGDIWLGSDGHVKVRTNGSTVSL